MSLPLEDMKQDVGQTENYSDVFCFCSKRRFYCNNLISQVYDRENREISDFIVLLLLSSSCFSLVLNCLFKIDVFIVGSTVTMRSMLRLLLVALKCQAMAENCKFCSVFCFCVGGECNNICDCENTVEFAFKV